MTALSVTLQQSHLDQLRDIVIKPDKTEGAAYVLFGIAEIKQDPWNLNRRQKIISQEVIEIPADEITSTSSQHITWSTKSLAFLLKRAKDKRAIPGIVHSHPNGFCGFSDQDNANESELVKMACNRNGPDASLVSLVLTPRGGIAARLWSGANSPILSQLTCVVGRRLYMHYDDDISGKNSVFDRQALAFGRALNNRLQRLRVGIVGCGGTGSAVALLLARLGVGQLILIDNDIVETTNLNRLHGARPQDVSAMRTKVHVVAREVSEIGLGTRVVEMQTWIDDTACQDALRACDVVFGCTDDHDGRMLLNRFAYFYVTPVIDMGLAIHVSKEEPPRILDLSGRITVLVPGAPCLLCRGLLNPERARAEHMKRLRPEEYEHQKNEAYVLDEGDPNPAVVTFTTETACMGVNELLHILTGYKDAALNGWQWTRRFHLMSDRRVGAMRIEDCPICVKKEYWGRGDMIPFLDRIG